MKEVMPMSNGRRIGKWKPLRLTRLGVLLSVRDIYFSFNLNSLVKIGHSCGSI